MNTNFDYSFSEEEISNYKRLKLIFFTLSVIMLLCILVYILIYKKSNSNLAKCTDTGLYRTLYGDKVLIPGSEYDADSNIKDISIPIASSISIGVAGGDLKIDDYCSASVKETIELYIESLDSQSYCINLSEMFSNAHLETYGDGERCYTPYNLENGNLYVREWITESNYSNLDKQYTKDMKKIDETEVPEEFRDVSLVGYISHVVPVEDFLDEEIFERDGEYCVELKDLAIDGQYGYVNYFGEKVVNLMELSPSKELRQLNPDDRFTWVLQDELTEVDDDWCTCYFSNKHVEDMSTIKVRVDDGEVTNIEINGFES